MPRPDVSEERRPQIVAAALRIFSRKGYHSATMPEIAAEAGLSVGGLYWYFKSKDAVVAAILAQLFDADLAAQATLLESDRPAGERLLVFVRHYAAAFDEHSWLLPVGVELFAAAAHDEQVRSFIRRYIGRFREALATMIRQGVARGELRPVDPDDAANTLLALEEGLALLWAADPDRVRYNESFALGVELFVAGLGHRPAEQ